MIPQSNKKKRHSGRRKKTRGTNKAIADQNGVLESMRSLVNNPELSDVVFLVGKDKIEIHAVRAILASRSNVFRAMLFGSLKEGKQKKIELNDQHITAENFISFMHYIFRGEVTLDPSNVIELLYLAKKYNFPTLVNECITYTQANVSLDDALELYITANALNEETISTTCMNLIRSNPAKAIYSYDLSKLSLETLITILTDDYLEAVELELFNIALKWIDSHNPLSKHSTNAVLKTIRYALISPQDLVDKVKPSGLAPPEDYYEALEFHASPKQFDKSQKKFQPRAQLGPKYPIKVEFKSLFSDTKRRKPSTSKDTDSFSSTSDEESR